MIALCEEVTGLTLGKVCGRRREGKGRAWSLPNTHAKWPKQLPTPYSGH